jgi:hypothetical protein
MFFIFYNKRNEVIPFKKYINNFIRIILFYTFYIIFNKEYIIIYIIVLVYLILKKINKKISY